MKSGFCAAMTKTPAMRMRLWMRVVHMAAYNPMAARVPSSEDVGGPCDCIQSADRRIDGHDTCSDVERNPVWQTKKPHENYTHGYMLSGKLNQQDNYPGNGR